MRRLVLLAALGAGLGCSAPAKRPFTAADLGAGPAVVSREAPTGGAPFPRGGAPGPGDRGLGGPGPGGPGTGAAELRVLADGRLVHAGEPASLAGALLRFDAARTGGSPAATRQAWRELLAAVDRALAGIPPPRLELLRVSTACETALAELEERDPALAAQVKGAVAARLAVLEERLSAPPGSESRVPAAGSPSPSSRWW